MLLVNCATGSVVSRVAADALDAAHAKVSLE